MYSQPGTYFQAQIKLYEQIFLILSFCTLKKYFDILGDALICFLAMIYISKLMPLLGAASLALLKGNRINLPVPFKLTN